jgi:hypothetical protein
MTTWEKAWLMCFIIAALIWVKTPNEDDFVQYVAMTLVGNFFLFSGKDEKE